MIHVPDVRATVEWYQFVGFELIRTNEDDGVLDWALLSFGDERVMFNAGGKLTSDERREVDLYVNTDNVDDLYARLEGRVDVRKGPHDTFYGTREFIVRDPNGFWVTFGEPREGGHP
jgi:uncharacterized glyoxalase superfamily protein PhnB